MTTNCANKNTVNTNSNTSKLSLNITMSNVESLITALLDPKCEEVETILTQLQEELLSMSNEDVQPRGSEEGSDLNQRCILIRLFSILPTLFSLVSEKNKKVAVAATNLTRCIYELCGDWAAPILLNKEILNNGTTQYKPPTKELICEMISLYTTNNKFKSDLVLTSLQIQNLISSLGLKMNDPKKTVSSKAKQAMIDLCSCCGNSDLSEFNIIPIIVKANEGLNEKNIEACVDRLASCTFVQRVEAPHLSVLLPILIRGLNHVKSESTIRRCCVIVDNMCDLVDDDIDGDNNIGCVGYHASPLYKEVLPLIEKRVVSLSDPEARSVAERTARKLREMKEEYDSTCNRGINNDIDIIKNIDSELLFKKKFIAEDIEFVLNNDSEEISIKKSDLFYLNTVVLFFIQHRIRDINIWKQVCSPYPIDAKIVEDSLQPMIVKKYIDIQDTNLSSDGNTTTTNTVTQRNLKSIPIPEFIDTDTSTSDLFQGSFSLAYGTITLLRDTKLHLKKNRFYGLIGPQQCGKTTLMRAIAEEMVNGFPKRINDDGSKGLVTIFVEHQVKERVIDDSEEAKKTYGQRGQLNVDLPGVEYCVNTCNNVYKREPPVTFSEAEEILTEIGFKNVKQGKNMDAAADLFNPPTSYSGGWKVKMQLCCARLINADILMLDEPTGHLDVNNIELVKNWLREFNKTGSIIASSSNPQFFNEMCSHIIDFCPTRKKLIQYKNENNSDCVGKFNNVGNVLNNYVSANPGRKLQEHIKGYLSTTVTADSNDTNSNDAGSASDINLTTDSDSSSFTPMIFPLPGILEGVKTRTKNVIKMNNVSYKYPTKDSNTISDINLSVSQASRIFVWGGNGSGKTTTIKVMIGELKKQTGTIFKHQNLRISYVEQHAVDHLVRDHKNKTATQYILWRFAGNDDKESIENQTQELEASNTNSINDHETDLGELRAIKWCLDSKTGGVRRCVDGDKNDIQVIPETILARRKANRNDTSLINLNSSSTVLSSNIKNKYVYHLKFMHRSLDSAVWLDRETVCQMGYKNLVDRRDEFEAASAGLISKLLTKENVEKELLNFGVDQESASHTKISNLSQGQRFRCVLAAAVWQCPHVIILDEPTNYLDKAGQVSLARGIKESYKGGVVIITHNSEFAEGICGQKWEMVNGRLKEVGKVELSKEEDIIINHNGTNDSTVCSSGAKNQSVLIDDRGEEIEIRKQLTDKEKKKKIKELEKTLKMLKKQQKAGSGGNATVTVKDEAIWKLEDEIEGLKNDLDEE